MLHCNMIEFVSPMKAVVHDRDHLLPRLERTPGRGDGVVGLQARQVQDGGQNIDQRNRLEYAHMEGFKQVPRVRMGTT